MEKDRARPEGERPVLQATDGRRTIPIHGSPLDPREALIASLLHQIRGTPEEGPLTRLLVPPDPQPPCLTAKESTAVVAEAARSAAPLGHLDAPEEPAIEHHGDAGAGASTGGRLLEWLRQVRAYDDLSPPTQRRGSLRLDLGGFLWRARVALLRRLTETRRPPRRSPRPVPSPEPPPPDPLAAVVALDRLGRRTEALVLVETLVGRDPDPRFRDKRDEIAGRLVRSPALDLEWDGRPARVVFALTAVVGRAGAEIPLSHPGISRRHLQISREEGGAVVRDLGTLNGTLVDGTRLSGAVLVRSGLSLRLAETVPCEIRPVSERTVAVEVGGTITLVVFEGPADLDGFLVERRDGVGDRLFTLTAPGTALHLYGEPVERVELCRGDAIGDGAAVRLRVA
jgi:hypothetical protein